MRWFFPFLLLVSCQTHSRWHCVTLHEKSGSVTRTLYQSEDEVGGIDLEWIETSEDTFAYLQIRSASLPAAETAPVLLTTSDGQIHFLAPLHEGGQRVKLPSAITEKIREKFLSGEEITLTLPGYNESFSSKEKPPIMQKKRSNR